MKRFNCGMRNRGVGLIEVLISLVVLSFGLLAVTALQGTLMEGSSLNKVRAEAQTLAESKLEQLRDTVVKTGTAAYDSLASSASYESVTGVNETFKRGWTVATQTGPDRKTVTVTVCWQAADDCGNLTSDENKVRVQSIISYDNVRNAVLAAKTTVASSGPAPSTNANSSDDIRTIKTLPSAQTPGTLYEEPDTYKKYIVLGSGTQGILTFACDTLVLVAFEHNLLTRRVDHDGVSGNEAIELYELSTIGGTEYCTPVIRYNGGVIIPIRGTVHSAATTGQGAHAGLLDVTVFTFNASESGAYCFFQPVAGETDAPYDCYVGGNCQFGPDGSTSDVTECLNPAVAGLDVGPGGWRGKVGLLGVAPNGRNVCFAEDVAGTPLTIDTARNYYSRNATTGNNEGINKPYRCHDFLIVNGQSTEAQLHNECQAKAAEISGLNLASKNIQRDISGNNVFDPNVDNSRCAVVTSDCTTPWGTIIANGQTAIGYSTATVPFGSSCSSVSQTGVCNNGSFSPSLDGFTLSNCVVQVATPFTISGTVNTSGAGTVTGIVVAGSGAVCNGSTSYNCTVSAGFTGVLNVAAQCNGYTISGTAIPFSNVLSNLTGQDFSLTCEAPVTYTVSGSISYHNGASAAGLTAISPASCSFTGGSGKTGYTCTANSGTMLTVQIAFTDGSGSNNRAVCKEDGSQSDTSPATIYDSTVNGNVTKNLKLTGPTSGSTISCAAIP